jgi:hypothetical protein
LKKAAIFGVGANFTNAYTRIKDKYEIVAFFDNSPQKQEMEIDGKPVWPISELGSCQFDSIIITSNAFVEIAKQLMACGVNRTKIVLLKDILSVIGDNRTLSIGFHIRGELNDYLIFANWLYHFRKKYYDGKMHIDLFCGTGHNFAHDVFREGDMVRDIYIYEAGEKPESRYDLFFNCGRYPEVVRSVNGKIIRFFPDLIDYIQLCEKFKIFNRRFFTPGFIADGNGAALESIQERKRIQQPDIYGWFGIGEEYCYPLFIDENEDSYLEALGLRKRGYITFHRGCDVRYAKRSVKLWPLPYYARLIRDIKHAYPTYKLVQIGVSHDICPDMEGVNMNLVGRTTLDQVKVLLKHCRLHIDGESAMVHLRHALKGGSSVVLFGPTSAKFFGYSENSNLKGPGCPRWCEWVTDDWETKCARGYEAPPCMESIRPEKVLREIGMLLTAGM